MNRRYLSIIAISVILLILFGISNNSDNNNLEENKKLGVAKILSLTKKRSPNMIFEYYFNGVHFTNNGSKNKYAKENEFHRVEFDSTNPYNSKIIIEKNPINPTRLIKNGTDVKGQIDKIILVHRSYADLYITYKFKKGNFSFRTRLHRDSLPCKKIDNCENSTISLKVADRFPVLNDLYDKSYDRQGEKNQNQFQNSN